MIAGAGTVLNPDQAEKAVEAGAQFLVSPGLSRSLAGWIRGAEVPFLPGVSNLAHVMDALDQGLTELKFFPAEPAGGVSYLTSIAAPIPEVSFCPTGGIGPGNAAEYLSLDNVMCVGGSWLTPRDVIAAGDYEELARRAADAASLTRG